MKVMRRLLAIIALLLSAGSGFVKGIAPPEDSGVRISVGTTVIISLFVGLLLYVASKKKLQSTIQVWIGASICLFMLGVCMFFFYLQKVDAWTYIGVEGKAYLVGEFTPASNQTLLNPPYEGDVVRFVRDRGGPTHLGDLCVPDSIPGHRMSMRWMFIAFLSLLLAGVFCLTEGALGDSDNGDAPVGKRTGDNSTGVTSEQPVNDADPNPGSKSMLPLEQQTITASDN